MAAFKRQEAADEILAQDIADADLTGPQLDILIKCKVPTGHTQYTKLKVAQRRQKYITDIKNRPDPPRVEDPSNDDEDEEQIPVPSIEDTQLGREREAMFQESISNIQSTENLDELERLLAVAQQRRDALRAGEESAAAAASSDDNDTRAEEG
jgi:hypothetical protein